MPSEDDQNSQEFIRSDDVQAFPSESTIVAISTPPGRGGIGIVRLSGPAAIPISGNLVHLSAPLQHARARFARVLDPREGSAADQNRSGAPEYDPGRAVLDEAVVTAFFGPNSYTGGDVVEIAAHGSPVVLEAILTAAIAHGARLAEPGEFTQRAFLAGRLDLTQAEAVHDLIAAHTLEQARAASQQLGGALSRRLAPAKELLLRLITPLEAGMDFASGELDDVDLVPPAQIREGLHEIEEQLGALLRSFRAGSLLRSGLSMALVGRPNAGKSSLFNALLDRPRAIVTALPGTTRDTVEEVWSLEGIPVRLIDTAGLRLGNETASDEAERQGIQRSREALADADLVLLIHDTTCSITAEEKELGVSLAGRPYLLVQNKVDLLDASAEQEETLGPHSATPLISDPSNKTVYVSALTGQGLDELRQGILQTLTVNGSIAESGALNNRRQQEAVSEALTALRAAWAAQEAGLPHEVLLLDLHSALRSLGTLTGEVTADDILGRIFSTFCIGK